MEFSPEQQKFLLDLARTAIRDAFRGTDRASVPTGGDPALEIPAGCFVSLHERGSHRLRGCIGRLQSYDPLVRTLYETAQSALQDPRFQYERITMEDLPRIDLEISVLSPLTPADNVLDFDPPNDGIYLICGGRAGTFLPQVARQTGWGREQLLARLCTEKMGLAPDAWKDPSAKLLKYKAVVIGPVPFVEGGKEPTETPAASPPPRAARRGGSNDFFGPNREVKF